MKMFPRLPALVRLFIRHYLGGFAIAVIFVAGMVALDVGGIRSLALTDPIGGVAIFVLTFFMGLTFASIECAIAVMYAAGPQKDKK